MRVAMHLESWSNPKVIRRNRLWAAGTGAARARRLDDLGPRDAARQGQYQSASMRYFMVEVIRPDEYCLSDLVAEP
jgi:hypothetical protein